MADDMIHMHAAESNIHVHIEYINIQFIIHVFYYLQ